MHLIYQAGFGADDAAQRCLDDLEVGAFEVFTEEVGRDFHRQRGAFERNRNDGFEPDVELLLVHVLLEDTQTSVPYGNMSFQFSHSGKNYAIVSARNQPCFRYCKIGGKLIDKKSFFLLLIFFFIAIIIREPPLKSGL